MADIRNWEEQDLEKFGLLKRQQKKEPAPTVRKALEVAKLLRVNSRTVKNHINAGNIAGFERGSQWVVPDVEYQRIKACLEGGENPLRQVPLTPAPGQGTNADTSLAATSAPVHPGLVEALPQYLAALSQRYGHLGMAEGFGGIHIAEAVSLESMDSQSPVSIADIFGQHRRLAITGQSGAGKSTFLQWAIYTSAEQILESNGATPSIPVHLDLGSYSGDLLELAALSFRENQVANCDRATVETWLREGHRFEFYIDALDEISTDPRVFIKQDLRNLLAFSPENGAIIASRTSDALGDLRTLGFHEAEVKPLSKSQVQHFANTYLGVEKADKLLKELADQELWDEASNPLILWFLILEVTALPDGHAYPEASLRNKGLLFKNVLEGRFLGAWERKANHPGHDVRNMATLKTDILAKLAFWMASWGDRGITEVEEWQARELIETFLVGRKNPKTLADQILGQIFVHGILVKSGSKIRFRHKTFRDYFAALELQRKFLNDPDRFVKQYITERWKDSILLMAGILDDPSDLIITLTKPYRALWKCFSLCPLPDRLMIAAQCVGASNRVPWVVERQVVELLRSIIDRSEPRRTPLRLPWPIIIGASELIRALGETRSGLAAEALADLLENHDCNVSPRAKNGFDCSGGNGENRRPSGYRTEPDCSYSQSIVEALGKVPVTERIQRVVLPVGLWHPVSIVRRLARELLARAIPPGLEGKLLDVMTNVEEQDEVRWQTIFILRDCYASGKSISYPDKVVEVFVKLAISDQNFDIRSSAAGALGHQSCYRNSSEQQEKAVKPLVQALLDQRQDPWTRGNAAYALRYQFCDDMVLEAVVQALNDENKEVIIRALQLLPHCKGKGPDLSQAALKLFRLFDNEDPEVKIEAIWSYGRSVEEPADTELGKLVRMLEDHDPIIRGVVAESLGFLRADSALPALKKMAKEERDHDGYAWAYAVEAVVRIDPGFSEVVKQNLWEKPYIAMLDVDNFEARRYAGFILTRIGTDLSLPHLKELLRDRERSVGIDVVGAITRIQGRLGLPRSLYS